MLDLTAYADMTVEQIVVDIMMIIEELEREEGEEDENSNPQHTH